MAEKQHHSEKDMKNYYKSEISRLEKELKARDHTIYDLRNQIKCLERKLKDKPVRKKKVVPVDKREAARLKAIEAKEAAKKARLKCGQHSE